MHSKDYLNKSYLLVFFLISFCGLFAAFGLFQGEKQRIVYEQKVIANQFADSLLIALNDYALETLSVSAFFYSSKNLDVPYDQFMRFGEALFSKNPHPITNVYFAKYIHKNDVDAFLLDQAKITGNKSIQLLTDNQQGSYLPLAYGYPDVIVHGADLLSNEFPYKSLAEESMKTDNTIMTPPIVLPRDKIEGKNHKNAFVLRHALFNENDEFKGIVGIAFTIEGLLAQVKFNSEYDFAYRIADITELAENESPDWFFDSSNHFSHLLISKEMEKNQFEFAGRIWLIETCLEEDFSSFFDGGIFVIPLFTYLFLAILVSFFVYKLSRAYKASIDKVEYSLSIDELTGLKSRYEINEHVASQIAIAKNGSMFAVLLLDLDHFKTVNDAFGYAVGDKLLVKIAQRLQEILPKGAEIGRLGADEFFIVLPLVYVLDRVSIISLVLDIIEQISKSYCVDERNLTVGCSIGISIYPEFGIDAPTLMKNADMAMHKSKTLGRSTYHFYDSEMGNRLTRNVLIESRLRLAMQSNQLELYFQPKVDLLTLDCIGLEALLRWEDEELGQVSPAEFIPIAENTGLILPLGEWVIEQACIHMVEWREKGELIPPIAINCSAAQLRRDDFLERLTSYIDKYGVDTQSIELEVTESILIEDAERCAELLHEVSKLGMKISLDDFGTGYSSLSYLKDLPFDCLKIDQVFIRDILENEKHAALTLGIIQMSHSFGLKVVAEGITNQAQLDLLRKYGCNFGQGYLFGKAYHSDHVVSNI
ncbi:EAL domain-containing protein [Marinomonas sp. 15G1-11]|uniref:EAL domain-containing protein n=1 Tax=Marinomonas phaeophyticola TaxID=3004091 RepID=A0ABT4JWI0_9GAMM|nr:EAL domain-containing protein [Marinomonas sp. 15G1-11]MCZ2722738.1 EAL domain-containing protein [Marinomonas sp. 15G1-11]